jgi:hypothetical protein
MKLSCVVLPILTLAISCATFSQNNPNMMPAAKDCTQMMPGSGQMAKGMCMPGQQGMGMCMPGRQGMMMRGNMQCPPNCIAGSYCLQNRGSMMGSFLARHPMRCRICFVALLLLVACVNILLTIIVCLDMAKMSAFNAIWIPITLIIGIPGTMLYALFRIGDMVKAWGVNK